MNSLRPLHAHREVTVVCTTTLSSSSSSSPSPSTCASTLHTAGLFPRQMLLDKRAHSSPSLHSHLQQLALHDDAGVASQSNRVNFSIDYILADKTSSSYSLTEQVTSSSSSSSPCKPSDTSNEARVNGKLSYEETNDTSTTSPSHQYDCIGKSKRRKCISRGPRIPFSSTQVSILENKFNSSHYLSSREVLDLALELDINEQRVSITLFLSNEKFMTDEIQIERRSALVVIKFDLNYVDGQSDQSPSTGQDDSYCVSLSLSRDTMNLPCRRGKENRPQWSKCSGMMKRPVCLGEKRRNHEPEDAGREKKSPVDKRRVDYSVN